MPTRAALPLTLTIVALACPAVAGAETISVNATSANNGANCGRASDPGPCKTIQLGASRAQGLATPDQIRVAPGSYPATVDVNGNADQLIGSGSCADPTKCTVVDPLEATDNGNAVVMLFGNAGMVANLRIEATAANGSRLALTAPGDDPTIRDVNIQSSTPNSGTPALRIDGAGSALVERLNLDSIAVGEGIYAGTLDSFTLLDSAVRSQNRTALNLVNAKATVVRRSLLHVGPAPPGNGTVVSNGSGPARIESSLITGGLVSVAIDGPATVVGSTLDPVQPGGNDGTSVDTSAAAIGEVSTVRDSLLLAAGYRAFAPASGPLDCTDTDMPSDVVNGGGTPCVVGAAGNTSTAPAALFVGVAGGDYRLKPGSPAVDTASATPLAAGEGQDFAGNPRAVDGNGDCVARRDRGAYELTGFAAACPQAEQVTGSVVSLPAAVRDTTKPVLSRLRGGRTRLRFRLTEAAKLSVRIDRKGRKRKKTVYTKVGNFSIAQAKAGAIRATVPAKLAKKLKNRPATYRVTLVATDAAGNRSQQIRDSFTVKPPAKKKKARRR